ncbi:TetR/AcrR family transcriptional regulator [Labedaea rhizosphaerae]|nr:helix-turn-helix domain-containing protein [Labedaea rhizosphaerae]
MRADAQRNRDRILAAAQDVFAEHGAAASTEEVARRAGVAIGTVFRHFPTKPDLLAAIMKARLAEITARAEELTGDPAGGLFAFFDELAEIAAATRTVVELLGMDVADPVASLGGAVLPLLDNAKRAGTVRDDVRLDEVVALLVAVCRGGWDADLRERTLRIVFAGLRGHQ